MIGSWASTTAGGRYAPADQDALTPSHGGVAMARKFFYICAGMFLLALSYHLGATGAQAQASGNTIVAGDQVVAYTANGDAYLNTAATSTTGPWRRVGNVFTGGGPVPATQESWGQVKARYR
jgi:hypothetical protein